MWGAQTVDAGVCAGEGGAGNREKRMDYGVRLAASFGNRFPSLGLSKMGTMAAPTPQGCSGDRGAISLLPYSQHLELNEGADAHDMLRA